MNRHAAWDEPHAAMLSGWQVGGPSHHPERGEWVMYAFDPSERPVVGLGARECSSPAKLHSAGTIPPIDLVVAARAE